MVENEESSRQANKKSVNPKLHRTVDLLINISLWAVAGVWPLALLFCIATWFLHNFTETIDFEFPLVRPTYIHCGERNDLYVVLDNYNVMMEYNYAGEFITTHTLKHNSKSYIKNIEYLENKKTFEFEQKKENWKNRDEFLANKDFGYICSHGDVKYQPRTHMLFLSRITQTQMGVESDLILPRKLSYMFGVGELMGPSILFLLFSIIFGYLIRRKSQ